MKGRFSMATNTPQVRFKGFTDAWEQRKFGDIAQRQSESLISDNANPCIEYEDIISEAGTLNKNVYEKQSRKKGIKFTPNDVLYGKLRPYLHNWLNPEFSGVAVGDWWVLRPVSADKNFLFRLIQTSQYDDAANQSSGTKMPRADWKHVSSIEFMIPTSIEEQSQIAAVFDNLDNLITLHQRKLQNLQNTKKSMLQKMFPKDGEQFPELRFTGFTNPWEQRKFGDIAQRKSESSISDDENPCIEYEDIVSEAGTLNKNVYKKQSHKKGIKFTSNDVLYGKLRPYLHNWLNPVFSGVAVGDWWVLRPISADKNFLFRLIQTSQYDAAANQSSGTKMPRADWKHVSSIEFMMPTSIEEQAQIAAVFDNLDNLITLHQRKLENLNSIKKALLQQMFV